MDSHNRIVAIVDDDPTAQMMAQFIVERGGHHARTFASAEQFLLWDQRVPHPDPECILVDLHLPNMDGFQLVRRIRERHARVPIIALSANLDVVNAMSLYRMGIDDFVQKPFDGDELLAKISQAVTSEQALAS